MRRFLEAVSGSKLWLKPKDEGIAIPISDAQGRFVGFQIRRNADDDRGRYKWLGWDGASKLPNGEYPLAYCRPFDGIIRSQAIGLAEGTGFKPQKAADLLGQIIVGASSGQFWNCPVQLRNYIGLAKTVEVYPDAGDVRNYAVMQRWHRVHEFLTDWGFEVRYAWWGQIGKEDCPDIDEGVDPNQIEYLSWPQFEALAVEYCEKYRQHQDKPFASDRSRRRSQSKPKIKCKEFENKQNTSCEDKFSSTKTDKAWSDWRKARAFKADQTINQQFFGSPGHVMPNYQLDANVVKL